MIRFSFRKFAFLTVLVFISVVIPLNAASQSSHFVLVHGAWHGAWCWYELADQLKADGHKVTVVELPGHGIDSTAPGTVTLGDYTNEIVRVLDSIEEQVILVGHSMGGIAISAAAEVRPEKITKLVYLAAFLVPDGKSLFYYALQDNDSLVPPNLIVNEAEGFIDLNRKEIAQMFYHSSPSKYAELAEPLLRPEPLVPFATPLSLTEENYGSVLRFYIKTSHDNAVTPWLQELMLADSPCEEVYELNSDHSPFFSNVLQLRNVLNSIVKY